MSPWKYDSNNFCNNPFTHGGKTTPMIFKNSPMKSPFKPTAHLRDWGIFSPSVDDKENHKTFLAGFS